MPFKKGQSGNPKGRRAKTPELVEVENLCKNLSIEAVQRLTHWMREGEGSVSLKAAQTIVDRGFGKAVERKEHTVTERMVVGAEQPAKDADEWAGKHGPH